jgi:hypothetical protein
VVLEVEASGECGNLMRCWRLSVCGRENLGRLDKKLVKFRLECGKLEGNFQR